MAIKIPGTLVPSNPKNFKVVAAENVEYIDRPVEQTDEGTLFKVVKEMYDTINATPVLDFVEGGNTAFCTAKTEEIGNTIYLPVYVDTRAPGYCTYVIEKVKLSSFDTSTLSSLAELEAKVTAREIDTEVVSQVKDLPGARSLNAGRASTTGEFLFRVTVTDGNNRPAAFTRPDDGVLGKAYSAAAVYYRITCGSLQLRSTFTTAAAKTLFSYDKVDGSYVNTKLEPDDSNYKKLEFPAEVTSPLAGQIWLRYHLQYLDNTIAVGRPNTASGWHWVPWGAPVQAGGNLQSKTTPVYLTDLAFKHNGVITSGQYNLYVEAVLTADSSIAPTDPASNYLQISTGTNYTLDVLPNNTIAIASLEDRIALVSNKTSNHYITIPLVAKTNTEAQSLDNLEAVGVLYTHAGGTKTVERLVSVFCSHGRDFSWDLGTLPAGTYSINVYCFINNRGAAVTTEAALQELLTALDPSKTPAYYYGSWFVPEFEITQAIGEGSKYVGQDESDEQRAQLLFSFVPKTNVENVTALIDETGKYQLTFNEAVSWGKDMVDGQALGSLELKRDQFGYLQQLAGDKVTPIPGCADIWKVLYERDSETHELLNTGFTLEAYFSSECIGLLNSHVVSMTYPRKNLTDTGANQGLYISYDKAEISDGSKQIVYPLLENNWQHLVFTVDREIKESAGDFNGINLELADINPLPTLRVYLNGTLVQVTKLADDAFGAGKNPAFPLLINAACSESPNATGTSVDLVTGEGLINRGACKLNTLRAYSTALRPTQVYNNYLYSVSPAQKAASVEKNNSTLPRIYFVKNPVIETNETCQRRERWYTQKKLHNSNFKILHGITQKKTEGNTPGSKDYLVNCTMYYKHTEVDNSQTPPALKEVWTRFPDVDVFLQGTSSLEYPVKNFKIKVYDETSYKINVDDDGNETVSRSKYKFIPPGQGAETGWYTEDYVYTLKCDYMEHSHRNNTPTACIFQDRVLDAVITACKKDPAQPTSDFYSPARQVTQVDTKTGETYRPYRDAIDGYACGVYYCDADTSAAGTWTESGGLGIYTPAGDTFTGSYMFNVDKEGAQLGFELDGQDYEDVKCISYEGGTNNNSSAAAFVPLKYSYLEYLKNTFNLAPANYVPITVPGDILRYYRYDQAIAGPNATEDNKDVTLYEKAPATGLNSTLLSQITAKGASIHKADGSVINIESQETFNSEGSAASKLYLNYNDYLTATFGGFRPEYRKFRKKDLANPGSFLNAYFADSEFGTFIPGTMPADGTFEETDSFGYLATQSYFEIYYTNDKGESTADLDNINGVTNFSAGIPTEKDYFDATLEPRHIFDEDDENYYGPMKKAVQWVYETADDKDAFVRDFSKYFSFEYCMTYYLQMTLFAQVDNAGKNAMFDIWSEEGTDGENPFGIGKEQSADAPLLGLGRLFPRPYDMDTQMGLDNSGADVKAPSVELNIALSPSGIGGSDVGGEGVLGQAHKAVSSWKQSTLVLPTGTRYNSYNTSESKLWKSFGKYFNTEIRAVYAALRDSKIYDADQICKYIDSKTYDVIGEKVYNTDAALKYLSTQTNGLFDDKYYRCIQGNRRNRYETFLRQRIIFLDSIFEYSKSETYTALEVRSNAVQPTSVLGIQVYTPQYIKISVDSGKQAAIVTYVDPSYTYTYQGNTYSGVLFTLPTTGNDKNMVITGAGNIQALRHLEHFYLNKCNISTASKLSEINLSGAGGLTELQLGNNRYLRHLDLRGATSLKTQISVAQCANLESVDISNSGITGLVLPDGANITSLNCKNSGINNLSLKNLKFLANEGLDLEGCTNISSIELDGCPKLTNMDFSVYEHLSSFTLRGCPGITEVKLKQLKNLNTLDINDSANTLQTINLSEATGLAFRQLKLTGCGGLKHLDLSDTGCTDPSTAGAVIVPQNLTLSTLKLNSSTLGAFTASTSPTEGLYDFTNISFVSGADVAFDYNTGINRFENFTFSGDLASLFYRATKMVSMTNCKFTSTTTSMNTMFAYCHALTTLNNITWDLQKVTKASSVFYDCFKLPLQDAQKDALLSLKNVTTLASFFRNNKEIAELPSDLFTNNKVVTDLNNCFYCNNSLIEVPSGLLNPMASTLQNASTLFAECGGLVTVPATLFASCTNLTSLDRCFYNCSNLGSSTNKSVFMQTTDDTTYFGSLNKSISVRAMFAGCTRLKITSEALSNFFSQLGTKVNNANYTFFNAGSARSDTPPSLPAALFAQNTNLNFIDGTFAKSYVGGELPTSLFCDCDKCRDDAHNTDSSHCDRVSSLNMLPIYSARGLFAGCSNLKGTVSNAFFRRTPYIRLLGFVSRKTTTTPTADQLTDYAKREGRGEKLNTSVWYSANTSSDSNNYFYTPGGIFANTSITSFDAEFLQPLTMLREGSGLFANIAAVSGSTSGNGTTIPQYEPVVTTIKRGCNLTVGGVYGTYYTIPEALFKENKDLVDASYIFCGNAGWTSIDADIFKKTTGLVTLAGAFMACPDIKSITNVPTAYTNAPLTGLLQYTKNVTTLNSFLADCSSLNSSFDKDLLNGYTKLTDCSKMFFNVSDLKAVDEVIPASLFNSCRGPLKDVSYMFAGCKNLAARIDTGWVIINDPKTIDQKYRQTVASLLGYANPSEDLTNAILELENKQKLEAILDEIRESDRGLAILQYLPDREDDCKAEFKAEFATNGIVTEDEGETYLSTAKDLDWVWAHKNATEPDFGGAYGYNFNIFLNSVINGSTQITLVDLEDAALYYRKEGIFGSLVTCSRAAGTCSSHDRYLISDAIKDCLSGTSATSKEERVLSYSKYRDTQYYNYLLDYYSNELNNSGLADLGIRSAQMLETYLEPINSYLLMAPELQTRVEFERGQRIIETGADCQIGLLAECTKLANVEYMFAGCRNLYGSIPADLFYNIKTKTSTTGIQSLAGLFDCCHGLTLNSLHSDCFSAIGSASHPGIVAYREYSTDGSTYTVHRLDYEGGGNYQQVYPELSYEVEVSGDSITWDAPTVTEADKYFIPSDWLIYLPNITNISRMFNNVGIMRDYIKNNDRTCVQEEVSGSTDEGCTYYSMLTLAPTTFLKQTKIKNASYAFTYVATLGNTVLTNDFMKSSLSALTDISYMFYCAKIRGFSDENTLTVFERAGKNNVLSNVKYAFCAANFVPYFNVDGTATSAPKELTPKALTRYFPRFQDGKQFTKISINAGNADCVYSHAGVSEKSADYSFSTVQTRVPDQFITWAGNQMDFLRKTTGLPSSTAHSASQALDFTWNSKFNFEPIPSSITLK